MVLRLLQKENVYWLIVVTESGITIDDRLVHHRNPSKIITESGITIEVREEQYENASVPMIVTWFEISTCVRFVQR